MSRVSLQPAPPHSQEQEHDPVSSLPLEADPSGFTERAPALVSLLPDEALSLALARGDGLALHAALTARLGREPSGSVRDTLKALLGNRFLFVMAEAPPRLGSFMGTGISLVGLPEPAQQEAPFIATRAVSLFGLPLRHLGEHLVRRGRDGQFEVLGRVASAASSARGWRWGSFLVLGSLALAVAGLGVAPFVVREVQLVNGLSRPVEVRLNDRPVMLKPGAIVREWVYSLGMPYHVEARFPGEAKSFEELSLESTQHALYNVLGAAAVRRDGSGKWGFQRPLEGRTANLESDDLVVWQGNWESRVRDAAETGRSYEAATLAKAVFMADPSNLYAGELAARMLARNQPREALTFASELQRTFPEDPAINQLAQEIFLALGERAEAFKQYDAWAQEAPDSLQRALWAARVAPPEQQRELYARLQERFPKAPEPKRAIARFRLADGYPKEALELLSAALPLGPETLEDLELRVRAMVTLKQWREASGAVRQFSADPQHSSRELAVLAGRVAQVVGPTRTQYVTRDLIPRSDADSPERLAAFALLTGEGTVTDHQLEAIRDPEVRDALRLTRAALQDLGQATRDASKASDKALSRLDQETAALLALELLRSGEKEAAERVFGSSLALMATRESLEAYVLLGVVKKDFPMLPPGLQAAAYLVRARAMPDSGSAERSYARSVDVLRGIARRALDADYQDTEPTPVPPPEPYHWHGPHHFTIEIIRGNKTDQAPSPPPRPVEERAPRPWPAP